jgi:hypothetical protein
MQRRTLRAAYQLELQGFRTLSSCGAPRMWAAPMSQSSHHYMQHERLQDEIKTNKLQLMMGKNLRAAELKKNIPHLITFATTTDHVYIHILNYSYYCVIT